MAKQQLKALASIAVTGLVAASFPAAAVVFEPGVGVGLAYTDNAGLTPDNEEDDWIVVGYIGASIVEESGPVYASANASLNYENYTDNTFGDEYYFGLSGNAGWEMIAQRVEWVVRDYFSQRAVDSLDPETPDNTQNTNVFTFGPNVTLPVSGRHSVSLTPLYKNYYYEDDNTDNQQYAMSAVWSYQMYPQMAVNLSGGLTKVEYDDEQDNPDYTFRSVSLGVSGQRARSVYSANIGVTDVDRDRFENQNGMTGNLSWRIDLTGHSSVSVYGASELTDTSSGLLASQIDPDTGDFSNEQISSDVLRNNVIRVGYNGTGSAFDTQVWGELRDLDYKETPNDREVAEVGVATRYRVSALVSAGVRGSYNNTKETDANERDKRYRIGADVAYQLSRNLRTVFDLGYRKKDSTEESREYSETSAFVSLVYGYGGVSRP